MKNSKSTTMLAVLILIVTVVFSSCDWGKDTTTTTTKETTITTEKMQADAKAQEQVRQQQQDQQTTGNLVEANSALSATGIDIFTQGASYIFDNGEEGYNFRVKQTELVSHMVGDIGITTDGKRFSKTSILDRFRPSGDATVIKFLGKGVVEAGNTWPRVDVKTEGEYTYYQCPLSWKNGYCLFNFAYFTAKGMSKERYLAHELVKAKVPFSETIQ